ncbi:hypothetical protein HYQ46_002783 [Verticillium longisporum]|nr:hypothetical protein HYQ46_002783 [Verticillium longisporum]
MLSMPLHGPKKKHSIEALDIIIANAGINLNGTSIRESTAANILEHISVNHIAPFFFSRPLQIFSSLQALLKKRFERDVLEEDQQRLSM